jgi:hypothetical protein
MWEEVWILEGESGEFPAVKVKRGDCGMTFYGSNQLRRLSDSGHPWGILLDVIDPADRAHGFPDSACYYFFWVGLPRRKKKIKKTLLPHIREERRCSGKPSSYSSDMPHLLPFSASAMSPMSTVILLRPQSDR